MSPKAKSETVPGIAEQISAAVESRGLADQEYWRGRFEELRSKGSPDLIVANVAYVGVASLADQLIALASQSQPTWMDLAEISVGGEVGLHLSAVAQAADQICSCDPEAVFAAFFAIQVLGQRDRIRADTLFWERLGGHPDDAGPIIASLAGIAWRASLKCDAAAEMARRARSRGESDLAARYEERGKEIKDLVYVALNAISDMNSDSSQEWACSSPR